MLCSVPHCHHKVHTVLLHPHPTAEGGQPRRREEGSFRNSVAPSCLLEAYSA